MAPKTKKEAKVTESGNSRCIRAFPQLKTKDHVVKQTEESIDLLIAGNINSLKTKFTILQIHLQDEFVIFYLQIFNSY